MTPIATIWIDDLACAANKACLLVQTHVFIERADDHVPAIAEDAERFFESQRREVIQSVLSCPVAAISLRYTDGTTITADNYDPVRGVDQWNDY